MASFDKQAKEGKLFTYFVAHRDYGPHRTLAITAQILGVDYSYLRHIAADWNWSDRCDKWDAHIDALARKAYQTEAEKQARQRAAGHSALFGKALSLLKDIDAAKLSEVAAAMKVATEGMRVEAGLATAKVELEVTDASDPEAIERAKDRLAELLLRGRPARGDTGAASGGPGGSAGADRAGVPAVH